MDCTTLEFSVHVLQRMFARRIQSQEIKQVVAYGRIIARYDDDKPYPSVLLLHFVQNRPLHVVVGKDNSSGICVVITVYQPDRMLWNTDFTEKIR